jgi:N6-adenosine-specific RNA methylase IME4
MMTATHPESETQTVPQRYKTIVIDPPWPGPGAAPRFSHSKKGRVPQSVIPYTTMTGVNIAALRIRDLAAPDSCLWIWATSRSIGDAMLLMELWGFTYRGLFIWMKPLGMGRHMRHQVEFLLWAGRPGARLVEPRKCPRQVHEWPRPKRHSEKPAEAYAMIADLCDGPRIDIFARQARPGFEAWGNEAPVAGVPVEGA